MVTHFTYDGGSDRHTIKMAVPAGMAAKACVIRGFKIGNTYNVQGKSYLILSATSTHHAGESQDEVELELMALSKLVPAITGAASTPSAPTKSVPTTHAPAAPRFVLPFAAARRKIIL